MVQKKNMKTAAKPVEEAAPAQVEFDDIDLPYDPAPSVPGVEEVRYDSFGLDKPLSSLVRGNEAAAAEVAAELAAEAAAELAAAELAAAGDEMEVDGPAAPKLSAADLAAIKVTAYKVAAAQLATKVAAAKAAAASRAPSVVPAAAAPKAPSSVRTVTRKVKVFKERRGKQVHQCVAPLKDGHSCTGTGVICKRHFWVWEYVEEKQRPLLRSYKTVKNIRQKHNIRRALAASLHKAIYGPQVDPNAEPEIDRDSPFDDKVEKEVEGLIAKDGLDLDYDTEEEEVCLPDDYEDKDYVPGSESGEEDED